MADLNVILKYRRPQDSWLCPECDAENTLAYTSCSVCGCAKIGTPALVKAWSPSDDAPIAPPPRPRSYPTPPRPVPTPYSGSSESNAGVVIVWTIVIILAIVLIAALILSNM